MSFFSLGNLLDFQISFHTHKLSSKLSAHIIHTPETTSITLTNCLRYYTRKWIAYIWIFVSSLSESSHDKICKLSCQYEFECHSHNARIYYLWDKATGLVISWICFATRPWSLVNFLSKHSSWTYSNKVNVFIVSYLWLSVVELD